MLFQLLDRNYSYKGGLNEAVEEFSFLGCIKFKSGQLNHPDQTKTQPVAATVR
jgi:hypothetical protein